MAEDLPFMVGDDVVGGELAAEGGDELRDAAGDRLAAARAVADQLVRAVPLAVALHVAARREGGDGV